LRGTLSYACLHVDHAVVLKKRLEVGELALIDSALGKDHAIDALDLLRGGNERAIE